MNAIDSIVSIYNSLLQTLLLSLGDIWSLGEQQFSVLLVDICSGLTDEDCIKWPLSKRWYKMTLKWKMVQNDP